MSDTAGTKPVDMIRNGSHSLVNSAVIGQLVWPFHLRQFVVAFAITYNHFQSAAVNRSG